MRAIIRNRKTIPVQSCAYSTGVVRARQDVVSWVESNYSLSMVGLCKSMASVLRRATDVGVDLQRASVSRFREQRLYVGVYKATVTAEKCVSWYSSSVQQNIP